MIKKKDNYVNDKKEGQLCEWYDNYHNNIVKMVCNYENDKIKKLVVLNDMTGRNCVLKNNCDIVVWKACKINKINVYVEIFVPKEAKRITQISSNYKSRIEYGKVISIKDINNNEYNEAWSCVHNSKIKYEKYEYVYSYNICLDVNI